MLTQVAVGTLMSITEVLWCMLWNHGLAAAVRENALFADNGGTPGPLSAGPAIHQIPWADRGQGATMEPRGSCPLHERRGVTNWG